MAPIGNQSQLERKIPPMSINTRKINLVPLNSKAVVSDLTEDQAAINNKGKT
jgi:hypothetical protein